MRIGREVGWMGCGGRESEVLGREGGRQGKARHRRTMKVRV